MGARRLTVADWDGYADRWATVHGGFDPRQTTGAVLLWLRVAYWCARPLGRAGVAPSAVTALGLLACLAVPLTALGTGTWPLAGAALVVLAAFADTVDGAVAVLTGRLSRLGYVFDAVVDRVAEACWLLALWLLGAPVGLVVAAAAVAWLHEYIRARASAAGMSRLGMVTVAERPLRVLIAAGGLVLAGVGGVLSTAFPAGAASLAAAIWLILGIAGLAQLGGAVHRALG